MLAFPFQQPPGLPPPAGGRGGGWRLRGGGEGERAPPARGGRGLDRSYHNYSLHRQVLGRLAPEVREEIQRLDHLGTIPDIKRGRLTEEALSAAGALWSPFDRTLKALLRGDGGVHPAVLHHAMRRTEAEIVHMIGNIGPAMYYARRNDQHVTDLQLDFA